jgi:hypothetical protein
MRAESAVEKLERLGLWRFCFGGGQPFAPLAPQVEARLRKFFIPEVEAPREIGSDKREHALLVVRVKKC